MSPREREVLDLLCEGRSPQRIATTLCLSLHTVRGYIRSLITAHGAESIQHLVCIEWRRRYDRAIQ